jgi:hypothetical protein
MRICYLDCHEAGLHCHLVIHTENLLTLPRKKKKKKAKLSLQQALEAHRVVRRRGSHIF